MKRLLFLSILILLGCGKTTSDNDELAPYDWVELSYKLDGDGCLKSASNYSEYDKFTDGDYISKTFIWFCTDYKGGHGVYVSLDFDNNSDGTSCLKLANEYIGSGICN